MTPQEAIKRLEKLEAIYSGMDNKSDIKALDMAIQAIYTLTAIDSICDTAEMIIEEEYGVVIPEGYVEVFDLIKKKARLCGEWKENQ